MKREKIKYTEAIKKTNENTPDEKQRQIRKRIILRDLGLTPCFDSGNNKNKSTHNRCNNMIFSRYYKTEEEYLKDKMIATEILLSDKEIPQELYEKLLYTKREIESKNR